MFPLQTNLSLSHQPYLFEDKLFYVASRGRVRPLFKADGMLNEESFHRGNTLNWQLWAGDFDRNTLTLANERHIKTGFYVICSPVVYRNGDRVIVSFVGGRVKNVMEYGLYVGEFDKDKDWLQNIKNVSNGLFCGFAIAEYTTFAVRRNRGKFLVFNKDNKNQLDTGFEQLCRIVPLSEDKFQILATGVLDDKEVTHLYQMSSDFNSLNYQGEIKVNKQNVYKCIINSSLCVYAVKTNNGGFEDRNLYASKSYQIT